MGAAFNEIGMVRLNTGNLAGAEEAFRKTHSFGSGATPGMALLKLAEGHPAAAPSMIRSALDSIEEPLARAKLLPAAVEVAVAASKPDDAAEYATDLAAVADHFGSALLAAYATHSEGRIAAAKGRHGEAVGLHRRAMEQLVAHGLPYEAARARCDLGMSLIQSGAAESGWLETNAARAEFERLGAGRDVDRIWQVLQAGAGTPTERTIKAMMFTGIVESTSLIATIGDEPWADPRAWQDRTLRAVIHHHGGVEIDHAGDGSFAGFRSPADAARCAIEIQRTLLRHRRQAGFSPRVRIGIHWGEALESGRALVGHEAHKAARVGSAAEGGEILVSRELIEELGCDFEVGAPRVVPANGVAEPVEAGALAWMEPGDGASPAR